MKTHEKNGRLPREAVNFVKAILDAGVYPGFFEGFTYGIPSANFQMALVLGAMARIQPGSHGTRTYLVSPILLGWELGSHEATYCDLKVKEQHSQSTIPGNAQMLDQLQPKLASTKANVFETKQAIVGTDFFREITRFATGDDAGAMAKYIRDQRLGFGLLHALEIAKDLMIEAYVWLDEITPVYGSRGLNRSLFIPIDYSSFYEMQDKTGIPTLGWYEFRVVEGAQRGNRNRLLVTVHPHLTICIPTNSLVAVGNVHWITKPPPHSD
ncbi:MAG: hypothetical protein V4697_02895 [Patescibacteria group bacterium]